MHLRLPPLEHLASSSWRSAGTIFCHQLTSRDSAGPILVGDLHTSQRAGLLGTDATAQYTFDSFPIAWRSLFFRPFVSMAPPFFPILSFPSAAFDDRVDEMIHQKFRGFYRLDSG